MSRERGYRVICTCSGCDGSGKVEEPRGEIDCPDCDGVGEVCVEALPGDKLFSADNDRSVPS